MPEIQVIHYINWQQLGLLVNSYLKDLVVYKANFSGEVD